MSLQGRKKSELKVPKGSNLNTLRANRDSSKGNNISIDPETGFEDLDAFWNKVRSPTGTTPDATSRSKNKTDQDVLKLKKRSATPMEQRTIYQPSFSGPSFKGKNNAFDSQSHSQMSKFITNMARQKLRKKVAANPNESFSPSALSTVSTAPPSSVKRTNLVETPASQSSKTLNSSVVEIARQASTSQNESDALIATRNVNESSTEEKSMILSENMQNVDNLLTQQSSDFSNEDEEDSAPLEQSVEELLNSTAEDLADTGFNNDEEEIEENGEGDLNEDNEENEQSAEDDKEDDADEDGFLNRQSSESKESQDQVLEKDQESEVIVNMDIDNDFSNNDFAGDENNSDDEEDDDKEGSGYQMSSTTPSPGSKMKPQLDSMEDNESIPQTSNSDSDESGSESQLKIKKRQRPLPVSTNRNESDLDENSNVDMNDDSDREEKRKRKKKRPARVTPSSSQVRFQSGIPGPREYESIPADEYKGESDEEAEIAGVRRSKRNKFPPLQFWKNEKLVFKANNDFEDEVMGDMPVVGAVVKALPTPYKKRKAETNKKNTKKRKISKKNSAFEDLGSDQSDEALTVFDDSKLRKKYDILDGEVADIWDESTEGLNQRKVVCQASKMVQSTLPITRKREKSESRVLCSASQAFNIPEATESIPGWISGHLVLPPRGIKDAEGVGLCSQVFCVQTCQPNALEVSLADPDDTEYDPDTAQRFLLNPGDFFHVPPNNVYRIQNHSKEIEGKLFFTIIRPLTTA